VQYCLVIDLRWNIELSDWRVVGFLQREQQAIRNFSEISMHRHAEFKLRIHHEHRVP